MITSHMQEVAQALQGVEVVIILMSTLPFYLEPLSREFFTYMFADKLAVSCHHVVFRITKDLVPKELKGKHDVIGRGGKVNIGKAMNNYGFVKRKIKAKKCKSLYRRNDVIIIASSHSLTPFTPGSAYEFALVLPVLGGGGGGLNFSTKI